MRAPRVALYLVAAEEVDPGRPGPGLHRGGREPTTATTDHPDDTPGLNLPFCMLSELDLSDVISPFGLRRGHGGLYRRRGQHRGVHHGDGNVDMTTATRVTIMKGTGHATPERKTRCRSTSGSNVISIEVTPANTRLLKQTYTVQVFREGSAEYGPGRADGAVQQFGRRMVLDG